MHLCTCVPIMSLSGAYNAASNVSNSLASPYFTYQFDKFSCWAPMYAVHVTFAYLTVFSGLFALILRIPTFYNKKLHLWCGRFYIVFMLFTMGCSLLIHNEGLPAAVLVSFIFVLGGMSLAYLVISCYRDANATGYTPINQSDAKVSLCCQLLSAPAIHGVLMFTSWVNLFGRLVTARVAVSFACYTATIYKPIDSERGGNHSGASINELLLVPTTDPMSGNYPWSSGLMLWGVMLGLGPVLAGLVFAAVILKSKQMR